MIDRFFARLLFTYGTLQILQANNIKLVVFEVCCAIATTGIWVFTRMFVQYNAFWHPIGLHIIPGLWACVVSCTHQSLLGKR
jgi:hypothetical protein